MTFRKGMFMSGKNKPKKLARIYNWEKHFLKDSRIVYKMYSLCWPNCFTCTLYSSCIKAKQSNVIQVRTSLLLYDWLGVGYVGESVKLSEGNILIFELKIVSDFHTISIVIFFISVKSKLICNAENRKINSIWH